jgi:hypothetical protein
LLIPLLLLAVQLPLLLSRSEPVVLLLLSAWRANCSWKGRSSKCRCV